MSEQFQKLLENQQNTSIRFWNCSDIVVFCWLSISFGIVQTLWYFVGFLIDFRIVQTLWYFVGFLIDFGIVQTLWYCVGFLLVLELFRHYGILLVF
jgi:predicted outer membrane lipoprotein